MTPSAYQGPAGLALKIAGVTEKIIRRIGQAASWLSLALVGVILLQVILRYGFGEGMVALEEAQWHLYAILVTFAISTCVLSDSHIRMDLLYCNFRPRTKAWLNLLGLLLFVVPLSLILFLQGLDMVAVAWRVGEASASPGGLPYRWAIKAALPAAMLLYCLAALVQVVHCLAGIFGKDAEAARGN